jgi:hypothetical protein
VPLSMDKSVFTSGPFIHAPSPKIVAMLTLQLWARSIPAALCRPGADKVAFEFGEHRQARQSSSAGVLVRVSVSRIARRSPPYA